MSPSSNATSKAPTSRPRAFLTRVASSFASKPRSNINDFSIELDDPTRTYTQGDTVKGSIQLIVQKPTRITHLVLSLLGFIKVYKNPTAPGDGVPAEVKTPSAGRGRSGSQYLGNGLVSLFEDEITVCGEGLLQPGKYSFTFEAQFPSSRLPSSLDVRLPPMSFLKTAC